MKTPRSRITLTRPEVKSRFSVGDTVIVRIGTNFYPVGTLCKITHVEVDYNGTEWVRVEDDPYSKTFMRAASRFEPLDTNPW